MNDLVQALADAAREDRVDELLEAAAGNGDVYRLKAQVAEWSGATDEIGEYERDYENQQKAVADAEEERDAAIEREEETKEAFEAAKERIDALERELRDVREAAAGGAPLPPPPPAPSPVDPKVVAIGLLCAALSEQAESWRAKARVSGLRTAAGKAAEAVAGELERRARAEHTKIADR